MGANANTREDVIDNIVNTPTFQKCVIKHSPAIRLYAVRYTKDADELDDLAGETWAIAWMKRGQYTGRGPVIAWLLRICRSRGMRLVRQKARRATPTMLNALPAPKAVAEREAAAAEAWEDHCMNEAMNLPDRQRLALICRLFFDLSVSETAKRMGCRPGTVKATLHAALVRLRSRLGHNHSAETD